jgi:hypothetical protein
MEKFIFDFEGKNYDARIVQVFLDGGEELTIQLSDRGLVNQFGATFLFIIKGDNLYIPATTNERKKNLVIGIALGITNYFKKSYLSE